MRIDFPSTLDVARVGGGVCSPSSRHRVRNTKSSWILTAKASGDSNPTDPAASVIVSIPTVAVEQLDRQKKEEARNRIGTVRLPSYWDWSRSIRVPSPVGLARGSPDPKPGFLAIIGAVLVAPASVAVTVVGSVVAIAVIGSVAIAIAIAVIAAAIMTPSVSVVVGNLFSRGIALR
jgi:hypothetical protein